MEVMLTKIPGGAMVPANDQAAEQLAKMKTGALIRCKVEQVRHPKFHRKMFALLQLGFEAFEPAMKEHKGFAVQKNFKRFRDDVIIAAGYYEVTTTLDGRVRLEAQSLSYGGMEPEDFEQCYSNVADVLLDKVLRTYKRADLDQVINRILGFVQ